NEHAANRFYREVRAAAQLVHPHIVLAYDAGQVGDKYFFAMEYIDGIDLSRLIKQSGPLPWAVACEYVRQAALGLQHAHERGLVHRDIKPANLLLTRPGNDSAMATGEAPGSNSKLARKALIKILDMGLARLGPAEMDTALTRDGVIVGTP